MFTTKDKERFWNSVKKTDTCWIWIGTRQQEGYGKFQLNRKSYFAHRISYVMAYGHIPEGKIICHHCDNPSCVRPDHLYAGTLSDNIHDAIERNPEMANYQMGEKNNHSKLTKEQVIEIRNLYSTGQYSHRQLAKLFLVNHTAIRRIIKGERWGHIVDGLQPSGRQDGTK